MGYKCRLNGSTIIVVARTQWNLHGPLGLYGLSSKKKDTDCSMSIFVVWKSDISHTCRSSFLHYNLSKFHITWNLKRIIHNSHPNQNCSENYTQNTKQYVVNNILGGSDLFTMHCLYLKKQKIQQHILIFSS